MSYTFRLRPAGVSLKPIVLSFNVRTKFSIFVFSITASFSYISRNLAFYRFKFNMFNIKFLDV